MAARGPSPQLDALGRSLALRHVLVSAMPPTGSRPSGGAPAGLHEQASSMDRDIGERHVSSSTTRPFSATKRICVPQAHRRFQDCLVLVAMPLPVRFAARRDRARHWRDKGRQLRRCRWSARAAYGNCREGNSPERSCSSPAFALAKGASSARPASGLNWPAGGDYVHAPRCWSLPRAHVMSNLSCFRNLAQRLQLLKQISSEDRS